MILDNKKIYDLNGRIILGITPPVLDFTWFDLWAKPAGLLNLLAQLRAKGNQVFLLDSLYESRTTPLNSGRWKVKKERCDKPAPLQDIPRHFHRFGLSPEEFEANLLALPRPDIILVTSIMTYWYLGVFEVINICKRLYPQTPVILGGIYALLCPNHAARSGADYIMTADQPEELKAPPVPLDLYDQPRYAILATSHGCPRRCSYCASSIITPKFRARPLSEIYADLTHQMSQTTVTDLAFYDDALLLDKENRFYPLCAHIKEHYPSLRLHTPNGLSVNDLDSSCCEILYKAGVKTLRLSLEGIDQHTNAAGAEKTSQDNYLRAVDNLLAAGYLPENIETYLLAGLPGQRIEDIEKSIEFVKSTGGKPKLCEFSPIPTTKLFQQAAQSHPIITEEPLWHNNSIFAPYLGQTLPADQLQRLKKTLFNPK